MVRSLDKKWKELLFAFSGFGPNFLMIVFGSYFSDAMNPNALEAGEQLQAIIPGVCFIAPAIFPILFAIGNIFDGIIDIPFAHITDSLSTKWGKRRPAIAVAFIPMVVSFILCWIPIAGVPSGSEAEMQTIQIINTVWVSLFFTIFFAAYTMCLIAFYGSFSSVCEDEPQRMRVSSYKSFFDTISYCLVYALVPVILSVTQLQINQLVFLSLPLMITMLIPLFMIKEGKKYGYPENSGHVAQKISIVESIRLTFKNPLFRRWLCVNAITFFGLQMFLSAMNGLIIGGMGLSSAQMAILNTCAFAPVPIMLYLFKKAKQRFGVRAAYQSCLVMFAVAIMTFFVGSRFVLGEGNEMAKMIIGILGGISASWSIGVFFMMPYLIPSQISSVEERLTGKNHSAMYYAGNAVVTSIAGAISSSLVYEYLKNFFITKDFNIAWTDNGVNDACVKLNAQSPSDIYNIANLLVPFVVCICCLIGVFVARKLPRDYSAPIIAREMKKENPDLDISEFETEATPEKGEIIFVQVGLWILSGSIFGFIWSAFLIKSTAVFKRAGSVLAYIAAALIPFAQIPIILAIRKKLLAKAKEEGIDLKINPIPLIILSLLFPILPLNVISLSMLQHKINKISKAN